MEANTQKRKSLIDYPNIIVPIAVIVIISVLIMIFPRGSERVILAIKGFLTNEIGLFYLLVGVFMLVASIFIGASKYGKIKLGTLDKPRHNNFAWGTMIFTCTMSADIVFYSLIEWSFYYNTTPMNMALDTVVQKQMWASTYSLFHWGPIVWAVYILPAVAYAYMLFVKGKRRQKLSEACRPLLKHRVDGFWGRLIDNVALFAQLAAVASTFSISAPLLTSAICTLFGLTVTPLLNIIILLLLVLGYGSAVMFGVKGISLVAKMCTITFFALAASFLLTGNPLYILETGFAAIGNLGQNFIGMATYTDPLRAAGGFTQDWTVYFWAFWMVWAVATPFFIGKISEGRTIRNTIFGGFGFGLAGTFMSFIIFGNFGLNLQTSGQLDVVGMIAGGATEAEAIISIIGTTPISTIILILLSVCMMGFYITTSDAVTYVISGYSLKKLDLDQDPPKKLKLFWAVILILLPIALLFMEGSLNSLMAVAIIGGFPMAIILLLVVFGFFKELKQHQHAAGPITQDGSID